MTNKELIGHLKAHANKISNGNWAFGNAQEATRGWPIANLGDDDTNQSMWIYVSNRQASELLMGQPEEDAEFICFVRNNLDLIIKALEETQKHENMKT